MVVILSLLSSQQSVAADEERSYENEVLGVKFDNKQGYEIREQEFLSDVLGFSVYEESKQMHDLPKLQVNWRYKTSVDSVDKLMESAMMRFPDLPTQMRMIKEGGFEGVALYPMAGVHPNTLIYVIANERIYEIRYFGEINDEATQLLNQLVFVKPSEEFNPNNYILAQDSVFVDSSEVPESEQIPIEEESVRESAAFQPEGLVNNTNFSRGLTSDFGMIKSLNTYTPASGCTEDSGYIQTQWNQWANNHTGTSWAGGVDSFWGQGSHLDCNISWRYNDYYALDHGLVLWNRIYPHRSGTVVFSGWMDYGFSTLGRTVVIDYGDGYYGVMSHLRAIDNNASVGSWVGTGTTIGYAGQSGDMTNQHWSTVHLHQSLQKGGTVHSWGGISGGQSARPYKINHIYSSYYWWNMYDGKPMLYKPY